MDFKRTVTKILVMSVVVLAIFSFVIITQTNNNTKYLITNNSIINASYGDLYNNISSTQAQGDSASRNFGNTTPTQSYGIVDVNSILSPTRLFKSLTLSTYNSIIQLPIKILGVPPMIAGVIDALLLLFLILGAWAIWRGVAS